MAQFLTLTSPIAYLPIDDIDTDQIIPASYLKITNKEGVAAGLFAGWRYHPDGTPKEDFVINQAQNAQILVVGKNFGCGSSREHAAWALTGFGLKAVVALSFADIFYNNALKNGLLPVKIDADTYQKIGRLYQVNPKTTITIDLENQTLSLEDHHSIHFEIDPFSKTCLLKGVDELGYLLSLEDKIAAFESKL
ncbi:MAG: 3-isopropylmalate dehydratase small subunit [Anaerolineae bacterium]|nr:3-isopropylmalate dehydratase small subunit [Anaerolineae bacterium]